MMTLSELDYGGIESQDELRLYETCLKGSREEIRNYCQAGDIQSKFIKDGMNPMHIVAIADRPDAEAILQMMLENGFDINTRTKSNGDTVLHLIVEHVEIRDSFPLVLRMLEYNPDLSIRNRKLRTPYDIALARGQFELAEVLAGNMSLPQARDFYQQKIGAMYGLLGNEVKPLSARYHMYIQAKLIDAVIKSKEADIDMYLKLGADPNFVNEHKNAPIHYAITHCKLPPSITIKMLIEKGADINLQDDEGDTALNLVIKSERLRESGEMYKCTELLVNQGALSTYRDLDGNDALQLATKKQYTDIVQLLTGTRPQHIQEPSPLPPTPVRLPTPEPEVEEEEDEPQEEEREEEEDENYLIRAVRVGTVDEVNDALIRLGADPNLPDTKGLYPIHYTCTRDDFDNGEEDRIEMIQLLLDNGADLNAQTHVSNSTILHIAATNNQDHVAKLLLDTHRCNYHLKNKDGKTPYDVAEAEGNREVMDVINKHRQKIGDRFRRTAKASTCTIL